MSLALLLALSFQAPSELDPVEAAPRVPMAESIGFLPRGLTSFGSAADGGWLYVLGGYFGEPHAYSLEGQSGSFLRINLLDPRDVRVLDDVEPVQGAELARWQGRLIRVGGMHARNTSDEPARLESSAEVAMFDPVAGSWSEVPDMPEPRSSHRAVVVDDTLLVVGGWTLGGESGRQWASTYMTLDLSNVAAGWTEFEAPFQARATGAAVAGGRVHVIGGLTPDGSVSSAVWILDPASGSWSEGPEFPDWGFGVAATELPGSGSEGAGLAASGRSGVVYLFDGEDWRECAALSHGRIFHEIEADGAGRLVALGGICGMESRGRVRAIERVALSAGGGERAFVEVGAQIERVTVPAPCATRNRFGLLVEGRSAYLFGGNSSLGQHDFEEKNFLREAWRLDLGNLEWTRLANLPVGRQTMQVVEAGGSGTAFAVGGFGHDGEEAVTQRGSFVYDIEFDDWREGPELLGTRSQFGLLRRDEELWVFGGLDYDPRRPEGQQFDHRMDVLRWDGEAASFEDSGVRIPEARRAFAGAGIGEQYYVVGGMGDGFAPVATARVFDFRSMQWSQIPPPSRPRVGGELVPVGGALYLVGGSSPKVEGRGLESNPSLERFDVASASWSTVIPDLGMEMKHARAFEVDGRLCVLTLHRDGQARVELAFVPVERLPTAAQDVRR